MDHFLLMILMNFDNNDAADFVISTSQSDSCTGKMFNSTDDDQLTCRPTTFHRDANNIESQESDIEKQKHYSDHDWRFSCICCKN